MSNNVRVGEADAPTGYVAVPSPEGDCEDCVFFDRLGCFKYKRIGDEEYRLFSCHAADRADKINVIFKRAEQ